MARPRAASGIACVVAAWSAWTPLAIAAELPPGSSAPVEASLPVSAPAIATTFETASAARSTRLPIEIRLSGYVQADGVLYDQSSQDEVDPATGAPLNQTRYLIRRARIRLDVDHGRMAGALELDANTVNGPSAGLISAEVTVRARARDDAAGRAWGAITFGLLRTPWGYEISERDQDRLFLERSAVSRALFPGVFDLGVRLSGGWRFFDGKIALVNGDPLGERGFPVRDPNRAKDIVGRLGISGGHPRLAFAAGLSGLSGTGFHRGTPETKDVLTWRDQNEDGIVQLSEIQAISGSAATPSRNFHRFGLAADARIEGAVPVLGAFTLFAEAMWAANLDRGLEPADPVAVGRDLRERGWVVGLIQELGGHFTAGGRYDAYDPDADASEQRAIVVVPVDARFTAWTATLAWCSTKLDRLALEIQHVTNPLGRTASGAPTTLGADTVTLRGQLAW